MAIFACKTTTGSIEVTERGHGEVAILVDELGEVTAIDLPAERAAALAQAILAHVGQGARRGPRGAVTASIGEIPCRLLGCRRRAELRKDLGERIRLYRHCAGKRPIDNYDDQQAGKNHDGQQSGHERLGQQVLRTET